MKPQKRFSVYFAAAVRKELKKLGQSAAAEILAQIDKKLTTDPSSYGDPLHADLAGYFKLRVSGYRVVYKVIEDRIWVLVVAVGKRNEGNVDNIYDWLTGDLLSGRVDSLITELDPDREKKDR